MFLFFFWCHCKGRTTISKYFILSLVISRSRILWLWMIDNSSSATFSHSIRWTFIFINCIFAIVRAWPWHLIFLLFSMLSWNCIARNSFTELLWSLIHSWSWHFTQRFLNEISSRSWRHFASFHSFFINLSSFISTWSWRIFSFGILMLCSEWNFRSILAKLLIVVIVLSWSW